MRKIMIVVGHPQTNTFCEALSNAYQEGAESAGHECRCLPSHSSHPIRSFIMAIAREQTLEPDLRVAYEALAACDHLVLTFLLWCGDIPALPKGFIERIL